MKIQIVEVGPRDGLQNESQKLGREVRLRFIDQLVTAGLKRIEIGAFVRPDRIPQMADSKALVQSAVENYGKKVLLSALVPNEIGMKEALETGIKEVAVFAAASETFSQKNINCSIDESFERFGPVLKLAKQNKIRVRGYLSTCFGCPYEGKVEQSQVVKLVARMNAMGIYEISVGDTIGVAVPKQVHSLIQKLKKKVPLKKIAMHFHDTRGTALANILASFDVGIRVFDSSLGGLGGCPYAPGASGNVATEDVVYMFHGMGVKTGVDLQQLINTNHWMTEQVKHPLPSRVGKAGINGPYFAK
jgi:hydroxymethylglutaryl-CoA lyase